MMVRPTRSISILLILAMLMTQLVTLAPVQTVYAEEDLQAPVLVVSKDPSSPDGYGDWYKTYPTIHITAYTDSSKKTVDKNAKISYTYNNKGKSVSGIYTSPFVIDADGTVEVSASATDAAGNSGTLASSMTYLVDVTLPTATMSALPEVTSSPQLTVSGRYKEANLSNIKISLNGVLSSSIGKDNPFSYDVHLKEGVNKIYARIADKAANILLTPIQTVVLDTTAPMGTVSFNTKEPTNESVIACLTPVDANEVTITSTSNTDDPAIYTFQDNGSFTFNFEDLVGNTASKKVMVDWIDTEKPFAPTISTDAQTLNADSITIEGNAEDGSTIAIRGGEEVASGTVSDGKFSITVKLSQNAVNTLLATATDIAGNESDAASLKITEDSMAPIITLAGDESITIEALSNYIDQGASANDNMDGEVALTSTSSVDTSAVGIYSVTYSAVDSLGNTATSTRRVEVVDTTPPVISINGAESVSVEALSNYIDKGASANDNLDGEVKVTSTSSVDTSAVGIYSVTYNAVDSSGNRATSTRRVEVVDTTPPIITLMGNDPMTVELGANYAEPGVSATDNFDGEVKVTSTSSVDTSAVGSYSVTYNAVDSSGNNAERVVRTVIVSDTLAPTGSISYSKTEPTKGIVTATLRINDENTVTITSITNTDNPAAYTFTRNGSFTFEFTDAAGNIGNSIATVNNIDTSAELSDVNYPAIVTDETAKITGNTDFSDIISATLNDSLSGVAITQDGRSFVVNLTGLVEGSNIVKLVSSDKLGNEKSQTITITYDTDALFIVTNKLPSRDALTGETYYTTSGAISYALQTNRSGTFLLKANGKQIDSKTLVLGFGEKATPTLSGTLGSDGSYDIELVGISPYDLNTMTYNYRVVVDNVDPTVELSNDLPTSVANATFTISGAVTDNSPVEHYDIYRNDEKIKTISDPGNSFIDAIPLQRGNNEIVVEAFDAAGNRGRDTHSVNYIIHAKDKKSPSTLEEARATELASNFESKFTDVEGHWAEETIKYMEEQGIANGMTDDIFLPDGTISRAQFATLLVRALGLDLLDEESEFEDIGSQAWYRQYVITAFKAGLVNGMGGGEFSPDSNITREQMAVMIMRAFNILENDDFSKMPTDMGQRFSDGEVIDRWAYKAVVVANDLGIINGMTEDTFEPIQNATRAQAIVMIKRLLEATK